MIEGQSSIARRLAEPWAKAAAPVRHELSIGGTRGSSEGDPTEI